MSDYSVPLDEPDGPPYPRPLPGRSKRGSMGADNDPVFKRIGICHTCVHRTSAFKCRAFPDGIPTEVHIGKFIHTVPYPGDHGIQFSGKVL